MQSLTRKSATIIAFPSYSTFAQAELRRWSTIARAISGWCVLPQPDGGLLGRTEAGQEYADIALEDSSEGAWRVRKEGDGWLLVRLRDGRERAFTSLTDALEAVCRTRGPGRAA
jgi:hypothetical protein